MRQVHVVATWQSEHLLEVEDEDSLENLVELFRRSRTSSSSAIPLSRWTKSSTRRSTSFSTGSPRSRQS